jgi:hypothetical protein
LQGRDDHRVATVGRRVSFETIAKRALGLIQRGAARKLDVVPAAEQVRRGDTLDVTVKAGTDAEGLEAGLVCTETFPVFVVRKKLTHGGHELEDEVAFERWLPVETLQQTVALSVPVDAPYSYDGENLKFKWRVGVRQRKRGLDAVRTREIWVLP